MKKEKTKSYSNEFDKIKGANDVPKDVDELTVYYTARESNTQMGIIKNEKGNL